MIVQSETVGLNMSSIFDGPALFEQLAYAVSKSGINQVPKVMAPEWTKLGVQGNVIAPSYFETEMVKPIRKTPNGSTSPRSGRPWAASRESF